MTHAFLTSVAVLRVAGLGDCLALADIRTSEANACCGAFRGHLELVLPIPASHAQAAGAEPAFVRDNLSR